MLLELVQHMFPPITEEDALESQEAANQFNSFSHWRTPPDAWPESPPGTDNEADEGELDNDTVAMYGSV
jgi:hypothetical protein